ncbi:MAG TPA: Calx-beta domain-containing protein [Acidimicrobiia bacterium]|nr:Calx-beta domain-containing protein [Acidimicrobiia bacterium]
MDPTAAFALAGRPPIAGSAVPENACGTHLRRIPLPYGDLCTHGPDPAPPGIDFKVPQPLAGGAHPAGLLFPDPPGGAPVSRTAKVAPGIGCYGDGSSGNRVQAVYAFTADHADRYDAVVASIRKWAAETDGVFQASAAKTGGTRRIRYVHDAACNLSVLKVKLTAAGDDTFDNTLSEFQAQGLRQANRHYLVWMDSTVLCGIASLYVDDRASADNTNNGRAGVPASVARIDSGCWGLASRGQSVEAHELLHGLGGVQPTAPNGSPAGHCDDDSDRMCYQDGSVITLLTVCPDDQEALFDCHNDDYFNTAPSGGSYLATHWNSADSSFLSAGATNPTFSIADASIGEGDAGTKNLLFTVTLSPPATQTVSVRFVTGDGTAVSTSDYKVSGGTLAFPAGQSTASASVPINGDRTSENDETFTVTLVDPANAVLGRAQAVGTIVDDDPKGQGYWFVASDGGIFSYADSKFHGSTGAIRLNQPVVGMARTPSGNGYWLVARDGGIFSFGDARFFGSTGNIRLNQPIVGMAATPTGNGYWFVAADGGIFSYGDARFFGSTGGQRLAKPIVGMAATPSGAGYWFVAGDGAVFNFGDARPLGSATGLGQPAVGLAATPTGAGYWVAGNDGALANFGDAPALTGVRGLARPVVGIAATPGGKGCWLVAGDGGIFSFGDARFFGSTGDIRLNQPIVGLAPAPGPR